MQLEACEDLDSDVLDVLEQFEQATSRSLLHQALYD